MSAWLVAAWRFWRPLLPAGFRQMPQALAASDARRPDPPERDDSWPDACTAPSCAVAGVSQPTPTEIEARKRSARRPSTFIGGPRPYVSSLPGGRLPVAGALIILAGSVGGAAASSHRERPTHLEGRVRGQHRHLRVHQPDEPQQRRHRRASWIPFEGPEGGPNYWEWDPTAQYSINVDNDGDAVADYTYTLTSETSIPNGNTFLYNTGSDHVARPTATGT